VVFALLSKNDVAVFKHEQEGFKVTLKRGSDPIITAAPVVTSVALPGMAGTAQPPPPAAGPAANDKIKDITSPMVGTFYASPSPDAQPFAKPGQDVQAESVVCIIEAMKVMNEIKSEIAGTIVEVVAENGKPVQFGEVLFRVRIK
jgi:acetyl-CoA carboxylase biotin carboxyl carrier protein